MKIVFVPASMLPITSKTLDERPIGGMETAIIRLAMALSLEGQDVRVITPEDNPPLDDPLYLPQRIIHQLGPVDVVIAVREWTPLFLSLETKLRMYWTGDNYDLVQNTGIGDKRVANKLDALLGVSKWHMERLCEESGFPREKGYVLRNGVHLPYFEGNENRSRKRLIYSSTPYRGLKFLPDIMKNLSKKHSDVELHVFSDYLVYSRDGKKRDFQEGMQREYDAIAEQLKKTQGCTVHGNVLQKALAREMMRSSILAYPNTFEETSCITAMEAQAAGCVPVTSAIGALPETVGDRGIIINEAPGSVEYVQRFTEEVDNLLSDDKKWSKLSKAGIAASKNFDWQVIAREFIALTNKLLPA